MSNMSHAHKSGPSDHVSLAFGKSLHVAVASWQVWQGNIPCLVFFSSRGSPVTLPFNLTSFGKVCAKCALDFDKLGGCHALATHGDPKNSIPVGCADCAPAAMQYCQTKPPDDDDAEGEPAYNGESMPERATAKDLAVIEAARQHGKTGADAEDTAEPEAPFD